MMESSPGNTRLESSVPRTAGVKRPAPSLLPPFEPLSSSPGLPRPAKRQITTSNTAHLHYPTPVPTSSTGILSSSPPRVNARPVLQRTQSSLSERAPLCDVPSVELNDNGETLLMGRSSNSSHYQLCSNRLVSRVHVKARFIAATAPLEPNKIEIMCNGWNGLKLHCQGRTWELAKGDTFTSETEGAEIMIDVQDARVLVHWPRRDKESMANLSDSSWDDSPQPRRSSASGLGLQGSPLRRSTRIASPESPTPAATSSTGINLQLSAASPEERGPTVQIYEDVSSDERDAPTGLGLGKLVDPGQSMVTELTNSFSSDLSEPHSDDDAENNPNEENDPIIHSFGPFGANLSNRLASFAASSPKRLQVSRALSTVESRGSRSSTSDNATERTATDVGAARSKSSSAAPADDPAARIAAAAPVPVPAHINAAVITNHVINQLAFSRLSSNPLSGILNNLPTEEKKDLTTDQLRTIIEASRCVGIIPRHGKDAAGKALESEYYYVPEMDDDPDRRAAVVDGLRKPSLRNCRKQHKQYFWKRPRTP